jgi:hypothetical protein
MRRLGFSPVRLGLVLALGVVLAVAVAASIAILSGDDDPPAAPAAAPGKPVKIVIAGTNDALEPVTDGGITGEGTFRATGAISDSGAARGYRGLTGVNNTVILLRYVTWGKKGTITYGVKIDISQRPVISRWKIESATKAYRGLQGKGIETENATYTVSTLRGQVWR